MIYIACALYDEAVPWIKALKLKKNTAASKFQIFESEAAYLAVTGTGMMNAAVALTYLCTLHMPGKHDIFVNTGVCGAAKECGAQGSLYLVHKITWGLQVAGVIIRIFYMGIRFRRGLSQVFLRCRNKSRMGSLLIWKQRDFGVRQVHFLRRIKCCFLNIFPILAAGW